MKKHLKTPLVAVVLMMVSIVGCGSRVEVAKEKALAEMDEKLKSKDREIAEIIQVSEQSGQKERDRLIAEGERMSKSIMEQARTNIEVELRQAREALKKEAAELALELAEQKIGQGLTAENQKALFEDALKRLEDKS